MEYFDDHLSFDKASLGRIVDHVFLPRMLPGKESEFLVEDEANILDLFNSVINTSKYAPLIPPSTKNLFETWNKNQRMQSPTNISKALRTLGKGGMFGYYVRAQNAGILIYTESDASSNLTCNVTLSTFPASLKSNVIMSSKCEVISVYPEQSIRIPRSDILQSEAVARQIVTLTNEVILEAMSTTRKGGTEVTEIREVPDTTYISEWLTSLLSNANSKVATEVEFPKICKKVRDNVVWKNSLVPFRRSGLWMTAKVILELSLVKSMLQGKGIFLYKLIMAEFMRQICEMAVKTSLLDPDVGMFMIKKLARRVKKLQILKAQDTTSAEDILSRTAETCLRFKMEMMNYWKQETPTLILQELEVNHLDTVHRHLPEIPNLKALINRSSSIPIQAPTCPPRVEISSKKIPTLKSLLPNADNKNSRETLGNVLFETESWIFTHLSFYVDQPIYAKDILILADDYIHIAVKHYKSDPVGMSRMILAFLKVVQVLDQIAVKCYPMLAEHRVGVNPVVIHQLLLPLKSELEIAHDLELYFQQRDENAKFPGLTEEDAITANSFSVRYGNQNEEMCKLRGKILLDAQHEILVKQGELKHARKVCVGLREQLRSMNCTCRSRTIQHVTCGHHSIQKALDSQSVKVYERPLRRERENQIAVVFELLIPPEIAIIRDIVILLLAVVCRASKKPYKIENRIWTGYKKLTKYSRGMEIQKYFKLGSTIKLFVDSHYKEGHPDLSDEKNNDAFIVNNGYNCTFAGNYTKSWDVKPICKLIVTPNSLYSNLQWTLETTKHTQNQVLASQVECPGQLRLVEYKEFGSLRAGHCLQLRNIIRSMVEKTLSFKEESVFSLICQAVWEAGLPAPGKGKSTWHRESHEDLANINFAEEFVNELVTQLDAYGDNWDEPYTLLIIVLLTCRVLEFGQVNAQAVDLLLKCRSTAYDWIVKIEDLITKSFDRPVDHVQQLKQKLVDACICLCWSYAVGPEYIDMLVRSDDDFFLWIHAKARIYNIITSSTAIMTLSYIKNILIEQIRNMSLRIESNLTAFINNGLNKFVRNNWNEGVHGTFQQWEHYQHPAAHVYYATFKREERNQAQRMVHLQVDILRGSFLVNGMPVGYLPEEITKNPTFSRIFKDIVFEVYPASGLKTFVTTYAYNNAHYHFTLDNDSGVLIIRERNTTAEVEQEFQLIPDKLFTNLIPFLLIRDYSHWHNLKTNCIDFRPVEFAQFGKEKLKFRLDLGTKLLTELFTGNVLFCVTSSTHKSIAKYLDRLEDPTYIHTSLQPNKKVRIELPRMKLSFKFQEETSHLKNLEYAMEVCPNQNFGTLIGLRNGLLIKNEHDEKMILVPHGLVKIGRTTNASNTDYHHEVHIDLENLREPSFFGFDVDEQLQQLRATKSTTGWLYLAYLHAITASPLADPLTGLTGTESAFKILQSGRCWSCKPYESDASLKILQEIKNLAPIRHYYPGHLQREQVKWPAFLSSSAAQDGFRFIVDKLLDDSKRLAGLFPIKQVVDENDNQEENGNDDNQSLYLSERAYIRYEPFCSDEGRISENFLDLVSVANHQNAVPRSWTTSPQTINSTRTISDLGHSWQTMNTPSNSSLTDFLLTNEELSGLIPTAPIALTQMSVVELLRIDFRNNWINIYELARLVKEKNLKSEWTTILSILAFNGLDINRLVLLQSVAVQRVFFQKQEPPKLEFFPKPNNIFNEAFVLNVFRQKVDQETARTLTSLIKVLWPIKSVQLSNFEDLVDQFHNPSIVGAIDTLNQELIYWNQNAELKTFLQKIEDTIRSLPFTACRMIEYNLMPAQSQLSQKLLSSFASTAKVRLEYNAIFKQVEDTRRRRPKLPISTRSKIEDNDFNESATNIFETGYLAFPSTSKESELENEELLEHFKEQVKFYNNQRVKYFEIIKRGLIHTETEALFQGDLFRVTTTSLLTSLLDSSKMGPRLRNLIGAFGVLMTLEQRANRCVRYISMGTTGFVPLVRERKNRGHLNWKPSEKPEWLLFEIESNLMIRPVQVDVAQQMFTPPGGKHSVMQLNMGEGKTAVIVPLLALTLATADQAFRVTVLKSLFKTNMESLVFCLGGLLNKRVYTFPCQRNLEIGSSTAKRMLELYQECQIKRGVIVTLPEHRLSFQLMGYEKCRANNTNAAKPLLELRNWITKNVRDVLDESDEILHAKYQLIYTLGGQLPIDGGALRWTVAQCLLKLIPTRMIDIKTKFGDSYVDICQNTYKNRPDIFHHARLLKKECYQQLIEWIAGDILDGKSPGIKIPILLPSDKKLVMDLLTKTSIDKSHHDQAFKLLTSNQETSILILMGYLKYEILHLVFSKRWRVSYGVDTEGDRKMAVPFRAKDVPAKRTEFGHPDVAILLTQLSYYYSGLSDQELEECFTALNFVTDKEQEYASWIRQVPAQFVNPTIKNFTGVNLADQKQKKEYLFPVLKKNMTVIDFYMAQTVFPKESRVFKNKLVCTSWDLCSEDFQRPITGFSGTNDSSNLLPAPIQQQDLPDLKCTNEKMRDTIMLPENNNVEILARGITAVEILQKLIQKNIPVLLDPGALMLELDNEGVARKWLELLQTDKKTDIEAAVYFDEDNEVRVKLISFLDDSLPFHTSSYVDKLDRCVIYLDDVHTRGTDLKIPPPSKACVTLCAGITRDKMVQACMRMRLLGNGHTIHFFANDESRDAIATLEKTPSIGVAQVMNWVCDNSILFEKEGLVYWAASGVNYAHKRAAEAVFNKTSKTTDDYLTFGKICCDKEFQELKAIYGEHRQELKYLDVLRSQIEKKKNDITKRLKKFHIWNIPRSVQNQVFLEMYEIFNDFGADVVKRCLEFIPDKKVVSHLLDEEQEKELEEQQEKEQEISRPPASQPAEPYLSDDVIYFIKSGEALPGLNSQTILLLHQSLQQTTMWSLNKCWCSEHVYATKDFVNVIVSGNSQDPLNEFLRPLNWVATFQKNTDPRTMKMLLLSPHEANELIPMIKSLKQGAQLRMFAPRLIPQQSTLIESHKLILPYANNEIPYPIPSNFLPPLFLFSGTLYFATHEEQNHYSYFTGILPINTRTKKEHKAVDDGKTDRGFVRPQYRNEVSDFIHQFCNFSEHPESMVRQIIETRHGHFPQTCHVSQLIMDCREVTDFNK